MPLPSVFAYAVAVILIMILLVACGGPSPPELTTIAELPAGRHLLINAGLTNSELIDEYFVLQPGNPTLLHWSFLGERDSACSLREDYAAWNASNRTLMIGGCFGGTSGLNRVSAAGQVTNLATLVMTQREGSLIADFSYPLREGAVQIPNDVSLKFYRHANQREAFAAAGTISRGEPGQATPHTSLYVIDEANEVSIYGEDFNFTEISWIDWSPDDAMLSFVGTARNANGLSNQAYRLDLVAGAIEQLSTAEVLIDSPTFFTADGAIIFAGQEEPDAVPALYVAAADAATATPAVSLATLPNSPTWRGGFVLAPNGRQVAFTARRDNPTTPWTIYHADLGSGAIRDLLPPDLAIERTGAAGAESPFPQLLSWDAAGQELVFSSNHAGDCYTTPAGGTACSQHLYAVNTTGNTLTRLSETHFTGVKFALWAE